ncbi:MAG: hypothetical protein Kow0010_00610 [Dehalococcoidia bacterium]
MADDVPTPAAPDAGDPGDSSRDSPAVAVNRTATGGLTLQFALDIPRLPSLRAVPSWTHQQMLNGALVAVLALVVAYLAYDRLSGPQKPVTATGEAPVVSPLSPNAKTSFNPTVEDPVVEPGAYIDSRASVTGHVILGTDVYVGPFASVRGDEGQPIVVGARSNLQDLVVIHAQRTFDRGRMVEANLVTVDGTSYAVYIGEDVSVAHQAIIHGPAAVHDGAYIGMQAMVFRATIGRNTIVGPGSIVIGVDIPEGRMVPAGAVITSQEVADALDEVDPAHPLAQLAQSDLAAHEELSAANRSGSAGTSSGH